MFFGRWFAEKTPVVLTLDKGGSERCQITSVVRPEERIGVTCKSWHADFDLTGAQYDYEDSRAGIVPELVHKKWVCFLEVNFPNGRRMLFAEPRTE